MMTFTISAGEIVTWVIIGLLAGTAAGVILKQNRRGFGWLKNLLLGLAGAFVGGILFNLLNIVIAPDVAIALDDVISAVAGAVVVVAIVRVIRFIQKRSR